MDSILNDVKQAVGVAKDNTVFDTDIVMAINTALFNLMQLGVGPEEGLAIEDKTSGWAELYGVRKDLQSVKSYVYVVVRLLFDRPETSYGIQALERMRDEWAWRIEIQSRSGA